MRIGEDDDTHGLLPMGVPATTCETGHVLGRVLPFTVGAVAACAALGSIASGEVRSRWYARLEKPVIQPPGVVFGPVWTALYADIAVTSAIAIDRLQEHDRATYERALAANLVLNASWSWVFFRSTGWGRRSLSLPPWRSAAAIRPPHRGGPEGRGRPEPVRGLVCVRDRAVRRDLAQELPLNADLSDRADDR